MSGRRAAIYARYSSDLQEDRSIEDQMALCRDFAARSGLTIVAEFSDRARTSASMFGRDGLAQLMDRARARDYDVILVEALDRLSRDQEDLAHIHKRMTFARIDILTVHEGLADAVSIGLRGLMGTMFLDALRAKTRRGLAGVIRDGRHAGGQTYGYQPVLGKPGERTIVEDEANVIRRIFRDYVAGESPRAIAGALNAEGVLPPRGTRWSASTINGNHARGYGILRNPMYDGRLVWNRVTMVRDPDTGRRVNRDNPTDMHQEVAAEHLRIVPQELFCAAEARREEQSTAAVRGQMTKAPPRPFSGLLKCSSCRAGMVIHDRSGDAIRIRCSTASQSGSCDNKARYRLDKIEARILDHLRERLDRPDYLKEFVKTYAAERIRLQRAARADRARLEKEANDAAARYRRLVDMMARGLIEGAEADQQILAAKSASNRATAELEIARSEDTVIELHPRAADEYTRAIGDLSAAIRRSESKFDPDSVAALRRVITSITIYPKDDTGDVIVEVSGQMEHLLNIEDKIVGGSMVARGGLEPPTP